MPNWCENELTILGKKSELEKFKEQAKGENGVLDFNKFEPYPEEWRKLDEAYWSAQDKIMILNAILEKTKDEKEKQKIQKEIENIRKNMPEKDAYNNGGYEWCVTYWGNGTQDTNFIRFSIN